MIKRLLSLIVIIFSQGVFAQLSLEYQTGFFTYNSVSGWIPFKKVNNTWEYRFYYVDSTVFKIYSSHYNGIVQYNYNFTQPEVAAGGKIYSTLVDLTGDGIVEFYVLGYYGTVSYPRQSVKILNIVNNNVLLELDNIQSYYSAPSIYDIDNDGLLEMIFVEYNIYNNYNYRLLVYNTNVSTSVLEDPEIKFYLEQNYPNPFNPETTIEFSIHKPSRAKLEIYDINGNLVKSLINGHLHQGNHKVIWNGQDENNRKVASGVYFYKLSQDEKEQTKKMIMLK